MELVNLVTRIQADKKAEQELRPVFITGPGTETIEDSILRVVYVSDVAQLVKPEAGVLLLVFTDENVRIAECLHKYHDLFGLELIFLDGVPGAAESPLLEEAVFGAERTAYHRVVGDIMEAQRQAEMMTEIERAESINAMERARVTNKKGVIKAHTDYDFDHNTIQEEVKGVGDVDVE